MAKIIVTGATGNLGGGIIRHLLEKGMAAKDIVALVRGQEGRGNLEKLGVTIKIGDYNNPDSLRNAFEGMDKLMFVSSPDFDNTLRIRQHASAVEAARNAKVSQIIYTSLAYAEEMNGLGLENVHLATEYMIKTTGIPYTFLRNGFYLENVMGDLLKKAVSTGELVTATADGKFNFVLRDDLALAAATVLAEDGHENKTYNLVNSSAVSFDEYANIISNIYSKEVKHINLAPNEAVKRLIAMGENEAIAGFNVYGIYVPIAKGQFSKVSNELESLIGRKCTSIQNALKSQLN
ncbi:SDR family oxidoreductase [Clostridium estertheticum]|uniref:SDR family oxidoreductase n=1 Tax=Clostridium estertheticum TaxID=238834 RepID=UPI001C0E3B56|nr:SDR family oxidoreductase [Clostridium estertheticum]MBU3198372.1 SDR family oxidoreductase [Clostridium estertheticum]WAG65055.1 SDR family oxidoreductase [Clostridium estertheticum]